MENSLSIPSSPSPLYFHILQTRPWLINPFSQPASAWGRVRMVANVACRPPLSTDHRSHGRPFAPQCRHPKPWLAWRAWYKIMLMDADARGAAQPWRELPPVGRCLSLMPRLPRALSCHMSPPRATTWPPEAQIHDGR